MSKRNLHSAVELGEVAVGHLLRWLVADTNLEASRAPVDELDGATGLEGGDSSVRLTGHNVTAVQQAGGHVFAVAGIALDHLVVGFEAGHGDLIDRVGLVGGLVSRDDRRVGNEREVNTGVRDQVGLELVQINVEGAIETQGGSDRRNNLGDQAVQVIIAGALNSQVAAADVVDSLVVNHEAAVGVLQGGVGGQDGVVGLNNRGGVLGRGINAELQLGLLAVVDRQTLHEESAEARTSATTERVENEETLETGAVVGDAANLVQDLIDHLLANGVVTTSIVVRRILLASNHLLGVEEVTVGTGADLVDDVGLKIAVDGAGDIFALA